MLHIILTILKILGILLLAILGLLVLVTAAVLFLPVVYRVYGEKEEKKLRTNGRISWLFRAVSFTFAYEGAAWKMRLRIFGFTLYPKKEKKVRERRKARRIKKAEVLEEDEKKIKAINEHRIENAETGEDDVEKVKEFGEKAVKRVIEETAEEVDKVSAIQAGETEKIDKDKILREEIDDKEKVNRENIETEEKSSIKEKKSLCDIFINIKIKIKSIFTSIKEFFLGIWKQLKKGKNAIRWFYGFLTEDETKAALKLGKEQTIRLWRHIKPSKIKGRIVFGGEDPAVTGQILGGLSILYAFIGHDIIIIPDFENEVLEGNISIKGCIQSFHIVLIMWKVYRDNNIRKTISRYKAKPQFE